MKLLIKILIVLLACGQLEAEYLAAEGSSSNADLLLEEDYEKEIEANNQKIRLLASEISKIVTQISTLKEKEELIAFLRPEMLKKYPTLCLPDGATSGIHSIQLSDESLDVFCDGESAGPGWLVIQRRINDNVSFSRTGAEYKAGFGNKEGSHFIGLRKLHQLTSMMDHELFILLESLSGEIRYATYNNFRIADEHNNFKLECLGAYEGTAGNALKNSLDIEFTAYDSKQFLVGSPTTVDNSGWWFDSKLNGRGSNLNAAISQWQTWPVVFKSVKMMIRPTMQSQSNQRCEPKKKWFNIF